MANSFAGLTAQDSVDDLFGDMQTLGYYTPPPESVVASDDGTVQTFRTAESAECSSDKNPYEMDANMMPSLSNVFPSLPVPAAAMHAQLPSMLTDQPEGFSNSSSWNPLLPPSDPALVPPFPTNLEGDHWSTGNYLVESALVPAEQWLQDNSVNNTQTNGLQGLTNFGQPVPGGTSVGREADSDVDLVYRRIDLRLVELERAVLGMDGTVLNLRDTVTNIMTTTGAPQHNLPSSTPALFHPTFTAGVKRRSIKDTVLSRRVREELKHLLGPDFFDQENLMSSDELEAFAEIWNRSKRQAICCDILSFKVDLVGKPHSAWNQSASQVFSSHFIQKFGKTNTHCEVEKAFYSRLRGLQTDYRKSLIAEAAVRAAALARKRKEQRRVLLLKRIKLAQKHPFVRHHVPMLQLLGTEGMSSDESDLEENPPKYHVHTPQWRAPEVTAWLHTIDQLDYHFRKMSGRHQGALPRLRIISPDGPISDKCFVPGLPRCAYNPNWLSGLVNVEHDAMPIEETYSFTHDSRLFSYFISPQSFKEV